jgi:ABC-type branched-subunit amino acid transport system ATPase component
MTTLLRVTDLDVAYGPVQVLFGVDLEVEQGEIVALLGTNGAGKSTLLKAVSGLLKPAGGRVEFDGEDITGLRADRTAAKGLLQMPGGKGVFPTLTVEENLRLGAWLLRKDKDRLAAAQEQAVELFPVLQRRWGALAGELSGGEQQMLTLAQAFMNEPTLLMIDELSLGLAPAVVGELIEVVHRLHQAGTTIIVVEQSVNVALTLAHRAVFMEKGQVRFTGATADLLDRPDVLRSVFIAGAAAGGGAVSPAMRRRPTPRSCSSARAWSSASAACGPSTASTSGSARARSSASSARTAPARRRCSTASPASSTSTRAPSGCTATTSPGGRPTSGPRPRSADRSRRPASTRRSPRRRPSPWPSSAT